VTDTNVWIDLRVGNLLDNVFELDARWLIPDLVGSELGTERKELLVEWGLEVRSLTGEEIEAVIRLNDAYSAPSRTDMATLIVARAEDGILVTGDGALREAAGEEDIEVHGTLWVVDALVDTEIVETAEAARALQLMMEADRRLPRDEVNQRVEAWQP
jgi:hypothetical protein